MYNLLQLVRWFGKGEGGREGGWKEFTYGFNCLSEWLVIIILPLRFKDYIEFWYRLLVTATFLVPWQVLMDEQDNNVYNYGWPYRLNKTTSSSLIIAQWKISFLASH